MAATQDPTCALIENARERESAELVRAQSDRDIARAWADFEQAQKRKRRLRPQDIHMLDRMDDVQRVLADLIDQGALVTDIHIGQSAAITLHRAPRRDYATGCVVVRRGPGGGVHRRRRIVIDGVRVEWPDEAAS